MHTADSTPPEVAASKARAGIANLHAAIDALDDEDQELAAELLDKAGVKVYGALLALDRLDVLDARPRWVRALSRFLGSGSATT